MHPFHHGVGGDQTDPTRGSSVHRAVIADSDQKIAGTPGRLADAGDNLSFSSGPGHTLSYFSIKFCEKYPDLLVKRQRGTDHASNLLRLSQNKKPQGLGQTGCQIRGAALARLLPPVLQADDGENRTLLCHERLPQERLTRPPI
jgi:hypothetical protein